MFNTQQFDKEAFKKAVRENIKVLYRKNLDEATQQQIFEAVCYTVKDTIVEEWMNTQKAYEQQDPKTLYYLSMEFLMGRALGNNLINLCEYKEVKKALSDGKQEINRCNLNKDFDTNYHRKGTQTNEISRKFRLDLDPVMVRC